MAQEDEHEIDEAGGVKPFFSGGQADPTASYGDAAMGSGARIGPYRLLGILGEGGYGIVYLAQQELPLRRRVALKVVKPGMDSKQVIARFEAERQALALLDHPNLAHIYDAGTTDAGRPYSAMEYVEGLPITEYCDSQRLSIRERLQLFLQVCHAVQHAHQKGIIHRDLKPSNILVTTTDGRPLVKVIDFGIAKALAQPLTEKTLYTQQGQFIGTPDYMSPEQAEMDAHGVDTRSDVYSLGVVLYELLTGALPFDPAELRSGGLAHIQAVLRNQEPRTPSTRLTSLGEELTRIAERRRTDPKTLAKSLHRELEWIPLKAMRKESSRRYQSPSELADDIDTYLEGKPLSAGPESAVYRATKFVQRHAVVVAAGTIVASSLLIGLIASTAMYFRAETMRLIADESRQEAEATSEEYRQALYRTSIARAYAEYELGGTTSILDLLNQCPADLRGWEWDYLRYISDESSMTLDGHNLTVTSVAVSPDGQRIASASLDHTIKIWDAYSGTEIMTLPDGDWFSCVTFSPNGERLAFGGTSRRVKVRDLTTGEQVISCPYPEDVYCISFSPDGNRLAAGGFPGFVAVWDAHTGEEVLALKGHEGEISDIAYSPDGARIASAGFDKTVRIWDATNGTTIRTFFNHEAALSSVLFAPDGRHIFSGDFDGRIRKWDTATGGVLLTLQGHRGEAASLAYSTETDRLVSAGADRSIKIWDAMTGAYITTLKGHGRDIYSVASWPGTTQLVSGSADATVKIWRPETERECRILDGGGGNVQDVVFDSGGRLLASGYQDGTIRIWDLLTGKEKMTMRGHKDVVWSISLSPDGKQIASGSSDRTIKVWDVTTGDELMNVSHGMGKVFSVAFSRDAKHIVSGGEDKSVRIWDVESGNEMIVLHGHESAVKTVLISPCGQYIASGSNGQVKIWDRLRGKEIGSVQGHTGTIQSIAFSPDGKWIASASFRERMSIPIDPIVRISDVATCEETAVLQGHSSKVTDIAFSPDGRRVVTVSLDGTVRIWDSVAGSEILVLRVGANAWPWIGCTSVAFSPDGKTLAVGDYDQILLFECASPGIISELSEVIPAVPTHLHEVTKR